MKIVTYNIRYCLGRDNQYDCGRIARVVRDADVICLQEVERFWKRSGNVDQVAEISRHLPNYYRVYGPNLDMFRRGTGEPGVSDRRQFGNLILSRWPILSTRNFPLPKRATVNQHSIQQGLLESVIETPTGALRVYTTHLSHLCTQTRLPQIETVMQIAERSPLEGGAWCGSHPNPDDGWIEGDMPPMPQRMVLTGDLNFDFDSQEYERVVGPRSAKHGRLVLPGGLADAWVAAGHDEQAGVTQPAKPHRIDHCFISSWLAPHVSGAWIDSKADGSDHYPLWIDLALQNS